jgi:hypothetical protein
MKIAFGVVIIAALLSGSAVAQEKPATLDSSKNSAPAALVPVVEQTPPPITQAQQDAFTIAALAKENAALKYQQASEAFDRVVASLQVPGYTLQQNPQTGKLERAKAPAPK